MKKKSSLQELKLLVPHYKDKNNELTFNVSNCRQYREVLIKLEKHINKYPILINDYSELKQKFDILFNYRPKTNTEKKERKTNCLMLARNLFDLISRAEELAINKEQQIAKENNWQQNPTTSSPE